MLDKIGADTATAVRARDIIKRPTFHLARMVDDLLDVTRALTGKTMQSPEPLGSAEDEEQAVALGFSAATR